MTEEEVSVEQTGLSDAELALEAEKAAIANLERELPMYEAKIIEVDAAVERIIKHLSCLEVMREVMNASGWLPLKPVYEFEMDPRFLEAKSFIEDVKMQQDIDLHKQMRSQLELQAKLINQEIARIKEKLGLNKEVSS